MSLDKNLAEIDDADRALRAAERKLLSGKPADVQKLLMAAVEEASRLEDREEAGMRLSRLADLCAQVPSPAMADALILILNDDEPSVRAEAGEALTDMAYDLYAEVARAIVRALDRKLSGPALMELPFLLAEVGEPSALPLIKRFLEHSDKEVVAAAIESLAALGDPSAIELLEPFVDDERVVSVGDDDDENLQATLGQLAEETIAALSGEDEEDDD